MQESFDEFFNKMLEAGAVELSALDENGNPLYSFTEKIFEFAPYLAAKIHNEFHNDMMGLWEQGFLEMDVTDENPTVKLTPKASIEAETNSLPEYLKVTLEVIKNAMRIQP